MKNIPPESFGIFAPGAKVSLDKKNLDSGGFGIAREAPEELKTMLQNLQSFLPRSQDKRAKKNALKAKEEVLERVCGLFWSCLDANKMGLETEMEFITVATRDLKHPEKGTTRSPYLNLVFDLQTFIDRYFSLIFDKTLSNFGKLEPKVGQSKCGDALFWFRRGDHFFVVPEEKKTHVHQGTALWVPEDGFAVAFVYDKGQLIKDPGFIISHKKLISGEHYTKVSYIYGAYGEKAFQGSSLKRSKLNQATFSKSLWQSFFKTNTNKLEQYFVSLGGLREGGEAFSTLLDDEGFKDFINLLQVETESEEEDVRASRDVVQKKKHGPKKAKKKHISRSFPQKDFAQSALSIQAEMTEALSEKKETPACDVEPLCADTSRSFCPKPDHVTLLEDMEFSATKWRDFWCFVNSVVKSLPQKPVVRSSGSHFTLSFQGMPSITIALPHGRKDRLDSKTIREFHHWLTEFVEKVCNVGDGEKRLLTPGTSSYSRGL